MNELVRLRGAQLLALSVCCGLALANAARVEGRLAFTLAVLVVAATVASGGMTRFALAALALLLVAWWWGSARLEVLDRSPLAARVGSAARVRVTVTGPSRAGRYDVRAPAAVSRVEESRVREPVLLRLPLGRAPPQGAILETVADVTPPRGARDGFDERAWLRRQGIHVVLRIRSWRIVGQRGGIGGLADKLRSRLARPVASGLSGEREAVVKGVVLGDDAGLPPELRDRFRAAGLYHLLAVSGQNVALVAGSALLLAWLAGIPRLLAELGALASIVGYVLAVGAQPSVVRAGVAGALASLAWLTARTADRWQLLLMGALVLLAWNPYTLRDAGFQLSFAAVLAIFVLVPRLERLLEGYPLGRPLRLVIAVSAACGLATAPISWLQFHSLQLLTIPANALAAPVVVPLLGLALAAAAIAPVSAAAAALLAWVDGWCAAYLVGVARVVGGLPFAQVTSTRALLLLLSGAFGSAAYALPRWRPASSSPSI